ncbi:hypothetical protein A3D78_02410 [Candidatus Gottesmanbacteria bacterium RIFCSPHIGHO2_02_FULL_39_14]|uniref:Nif3-like dinuclear metal center hexameric protein n=1 Tax=Candidatus Gottesmanbacteria bacterium RIFCSPHIGHO2_02_FULL_39_14 TaxID=1798383 RepID=A0A1F6A2E1_9BACT|nr:MAG: hypothetical protein A3D78_02410 [Candidatus Gottesmanbacteria bacterium RIFCSPHIGHO2_02_FULL_39_14]
MISLADLSLYLNKLMFFDPKLDVEKVDPYMTNGLMIKGSDQIENIGFAVSASVELFKLAKQNNCQVVIVHHSFNLPKTNNYDYIFQERFAYLIKNNLSLFAYHFLLDAHPEIGNNVSILKTIGATPDKPFLHHGNPWGYTGIFHRPRPVSDLKKILSSYFSPRSVYYDFGSQSVKKVVAVSGKGAPLASSMSDLINDKVDLYITGEVHEWNRELFREAGINFIAGGHYHTEMFGIKALLEKLKKDLPQITPLWLDLTNEV